MQSKIKLQEHNINTYESIKDAYKERNHIGVVQATGTGKSFLIANTIEDMDFKKVLFLTPSKYIISEFKDSFKFSNKKMDFMTYKKLTYINDLESFLEERDYDFVVLDEYHRCGAKTWGEPVKYIISKYSDKKILGVTATPIRFLDNSRDMTKELFNSEPIVEISLLKAIEEDILPKPKYVLSYYNIKDEVERIRLKKEKTINDDDTLNNIKYIVKNIDLITKMEDVLSKNITSERKFIVFCSNIEHLKEMLKTVPSWFYNIGYKVNSFALYTNEDKQITSKQLATELDRFKNSKSSEGSVNLLFTINMLNEGVHIKDVDGLIFLRKTVSPIILYQQLGRALKAGDKKAPIIFDLVNNINELSFNDARTSSSEPIDRVRSITNDYYLNSEIEIIDYTKDVNELLKEMEDIISLNSWSSFVEKIRKYKDENGNCEIPSGHPLYKRCLKVRRDYENGLLDEHKFKDLDDLGFKWDISIYNDAHWEIMFNKMLEFKKKFNHVNVPASYEDKQLATWIKTQRKFKDIMPVERKERLLAVGFEFEIGKKKNEEEWNIMFDKLLDFKKEFNHVNVSSRYEDKKLANWVNSQRKAYKAGKLSKERYDKLISVGFKFPDVKNLA